MSENEVFRFAESTAYLQNCEAHLSRSLVVGEMLDQNNMHTLEHLTIQVYLDVKMRAEYTQHVHVGRYNSPPHFNLHLTKSYPTNLTVCFLSGRRKAGGHKSEREESVLPDHTTPSGEPRDVETSVGGRGSGRGPERGAELHW